MQNYQTITKNAIKFELECLAIDRQIMNYRRQFYNEARAELSEINKLGKRAAICSKSRVFSSMNHWRALLKESMADVSKRLEDIRFLKAEYHLNDFAARLMEAA